MVRCADVPDESTASRLSSHRQSCGGWYTPVSSWVALIARFAVNFSNGFQMVQLFVICCCFVIACFSNRITCPPFVPGIPFHFNLRFACCSALRTSSFVVSHQRGGNLHILSRYMCGLCVGRNKAIITTWAIAIQVV